jgi:hypothetical protein
MKITIEVPEDIGKQLQQNWGNLPQKILEVLAIEGYRNKIMTSLEIQQLLKLPSVREAEDFLKESQIAADYLEKDLLQDTEINSSLLHALQELQNVCIDEDYYLEIPSRQDRPNLFF